jgi:insulysin
LFTIFEKKKKIFQKYIAIDGPSRHALSIHVVSKVEDGLEVIPFDGTNTDKSTTPDTQKPILITDLTTFKSSKELYPMVEPYIIIKPKGGKCKL